MVFQVSNLIYNIVNCTILTVGMIPRIILPSFLNTMHTCTLYCSILHCEISVSFYEDQDHLHSVTVHHMTQTQTGNVSIFIINVHFQLILFSNIDINACQIHFKMTFE